MKRKIVDYRASKVTTQDVSSQGTRKVKKRKQAPRRKYTIPLEIIQLLIKAGYADPTKDKIRRKKSIQAHILHQLIFASHSDALSPSEKAELRIYAIQFWIDDEDLTTHTPAVYNLKFLEDDITNPEEDDISKARKTYQEYFHEKLKDHMAIPIEFFNEFLSIILTAVYDRDANKNRKNVDALFKTLHSHVEKIYELYSKLDLKQEKVGKKKRIISRDEMWRKCKEVCGKKLTQKEERLYHAILGKVLRLKNKPQDTDKIKESITLLLYLHENPEEKKLLLHAEGKKVLSKIIYDILSY